LAEPIITHPRLWPTFSESVPALQISVLGLPFIFINLLSATLLNATNRQKINILNIGLTMLCNIILNFIMIPHWQHVGSSFAALGSAIILFILNLAWIWKIFPVNVRWMLGRIWRVVFATLAMFALLVLLRDRLTIFLLAPIALVIYVIAFISVGGITRSEFQVIVDMIRRKKRGPNA
jgi:O-antigen/teichoic acid export membrane protein